MKTNLNFILFFLILSLISCKSSKKSIDNNIVTTNTEVKEGIRTTGIKTKFDDLNIITDITEFTRYEPVYYIKDGKDIVELKSVTYKKQSKFENIKKQEIFENKSDVDKEIITNEVIDKTKIKKEFEGYNIFNTIITYIIILLLIIGLYIYFKKLKLFI